MRKSSFFSQKLTLWWCLDIGQLIPEGGKQLRNRDAILPQWWGVHLLLMWLLFDNCLCHATHWVIIAFNIPLSRSLKKKYWKRGKKSGLAIGFKLLTTITEFFVPSYQLHSRSRWLCPTHGHTLKSLPFLGWVAPLLETLLQLYSFETAVLHREWWCSGGANPHVIVNMFAFLTFFPLSLTRTRNKVT